MRILIVSATASEVSFLLPADISSKPGIVTSVFHTPHLIDVLITGVGMMQTAFYLGMCLQKNKYDLLLNVGLAGALSKDLQIGEVAEVICDSFADLGAEDHESFLNVFDLGLANPGEFPFNEGKLFAHHLYKDKLNSLKRVEGITVNKVHGNEQTIKYLVKTCKADVETMEGAAFLYAAKFHEMDCIQLRAISNYVEKRDKSKWNIPLAMDSLEIVVKNFLNTIS